MPGFVAYRGPSMIDGSPIVLIVNTGESTNEKTGAMAQTYILRADTDPITANRIGADVAICGSCPHRGTSLSLAVARAMVDAMDKGKERTALRRQIRTAEEASATHISYKRSCYVNIGQGALVTYRALLAGSYPDARPEFVAQILTGRRVRLGTYGDPAAIPANVWRALLTHADGHTGYTHQWRDMSEERRAEFRPLTMASADSEQDRTDAVAAGFRTFRVRSESQPMMSGEIVCPASEEGGRKTVCETCGLCAGTTARTSKTVAIIAHGAGSTHFVAA